MAALKKKSNSDKENNSGSLENSEPEFLAVGKIGKTHGLTGELWLNLLTDFPERLAKGKRVFIGKRYQEYEIIDFRLNLNRGLIRFNEFTTPEDARILTNQIIYVKAEMMPQLPDGDYYFHDLIGIQVVDEDQNSIGTIEDVIKTGANDVYLVRKNSADQEELLIPAIKSVIIQVNIEERKMVVRLQEWA